MTLWTRDLVMAALLACSAVLTSCNTIEGAGKDVERGGEAVQDAANANRPK